jgi:hypothetical protein
MRNYPKYLALKHSGKSVSSSSSFFCLQLDCKGSKKLENQEKKRQALEVWSWNVLVFYIGNILVDKNILCNGYFLTGLSVLFRVFK